MIAVSVFGGACPAVPDAQVLRYLGVRPASAPADVRALAQQAIAAVARSAACRCAWARVPVTQSGAHVTLGPLETVSAALAKNLSGCREAYLFGATVGVGPERLIAGGRTLSPARALAADAAGSAAIECWCDEICRRFALQTPYLRPRFSPGYGDLSIAVQADFVTLLDLSRKLGLSLTDGMMLLPSKSVTAIVGVSDAPGSCAAASCLDCAMTTCPYRD